MAAQATVAEEFAAALAGDCAPSDIGIPFYNLPTVGLFESWQQLVHRSD